MKQAARLLFAFLFLILGFGTSLADTPLTKEVMKFVEDQLVEKGLERSRARSLLEDPRIVIDSEIIMKNLFHSSPKPSEKKPLYMEIDPAYIEKGRTFISSHTGTFTSVRYDYDVSAEIITAILIVESRLGTYPMKYNVFQAYTNLAVILDPDYFSGLKETYITSYPTLSDEKMVKRAQTKGAWALNQLYSLIVLADELEIDPLGINGSFAGALGPGQFIPTSFQDYGVDGDSDGKKDPFNMKDAIASIAHYLKKAGWSEGASAEKKRKAVWYYNHSDIYVNTIMMLYRELSRDTIDSPH